MFSQRMELIRTDHVKKRMYVKVLLYCYGSKEDEQARIKENELINEAFNNGYLIICDGRVILNCSKNTRKRKKSKR